MRISDLGSRISTVTRRDRSLTSAFSANPQWARVALAALVLLVAVVFWRHIFTSDVPFYRDISFAHFPRAVELRGLVRSGQLPLWNPFEHFGEPVAVNANYLLFYPTTWLAWLLPAAYGFKLHYVLHFFLLAAGSFLLARRIGLSPFACFLAGALFVFSGPVMSLGNFYNVLPAVAWMPMAILAADYQMRRGGWKGAAALAAALAMQLFAGEPFTSIVTAGLALAWMLAFYGAGRGSAFSGANRAVFVRFLGAMALTAGLSAVQVFPALWHMPDTGRASLGFEQAFFWSLHPLKLLEAVVPDLWGNPLYDSSPWLYLEGRETYFLLSVFIGIIPLALALLAISDFGLEKPGAWLEIRNPQSAIGIRYWAFVGLVAFILALGRYTPASYVFYPGAHPAPAARSPQPPGLRRGAGRRAAGAVTAAGRRRICRIDTLSPGAGAGAGRHFPERHYHPRTAVPHP